MFRLGLQELIILFVLFVPIGLMLIAFVDILRSERKLRRGAGGIIVSVKRGYSLNNRRSHV